MTKIKIFVFNSFQENTYLIYDETNECVIVDAGCNNEREYNIINNFISENSLSLKYIINTHCHIDHIMGNAYLANKYGVESIANKEDLPLLERAKDMAVAYGLNFQEPPIPSHLVNEGDEIKFGNSSLLVKHVPGHSPGSIALYSDNEKFVIVGDVLFKRGIGRSDFPGGDYDTLIASIKNKLFTLNNDVIVYPGHGESTTIGNEKSDNPFF